MRYAGISLAKVGFLGLEGDQGLQNMIFGPEIALFYEMIGGC